MNNFPSCRALREVKGVFIPAIIRNGHYFLIDMSIFEDGVVDCWENVDLALFKAKLRNNWVVPNIAEDETLNISMTGDVQIKNAVWKFSNHKQLFNHVKGIVKKLNPTMTNLYDMKGTSTYVPDGLKIRTSKLSGASPERFKRRDDIFSRPVKGEAFHHFMKENDGAYYYVNIILYDDDTVEILGGKEPIYSSLSEFAKWLNDSDKFSFPQTGERIVIQNLVSFDTGSVQWYVGRDEKIGDFGETVRKLRGEPSLVTLCTEAFAKHIDHPSKKTLHELRIAYEKVPKHLRMFCGGQDEKDIPIRIALYGEKEIEGWSHWQAAKEQGLELPNIQVPKTSD